MDTAVVHNKSELMINVKWNLPHKILKTNRTIKRTRNSVDIA